MTNKEAAEFIWDVLDGTKSFNEKGGRGLEALELAIKALKNERLQGKWIFHKDYNESCRYGCNQCGNLNNIPGNFCPNCGAGMKFVMKKEKGGVK